MGHDGHTIRCVDVCPILRREETVEQLLLVGETPQWEKHHLQKFLKYRLFLELRVVLALRSQLWRHVNVRFQEHVASYQFVHESSQKNRRRT